MRTEREGVKLLNAHPSSKTDPAVKRKIMRSHGGHRYEVDEKCELLFVEKFQIRGSSGATGGVSGPVYRTNTSLAETPLTPAKRQPTGRQLFVIRSRLAQGHS